ncbi:Tho complex subunit 7/Mft1p [Purpureocillium lilacinum]|uniref:Tho complex subunit 7/Mft1p n=1 Tax=Purpureocillium lilacinum TaxID=33203 RepID=A0A2U3EJZ6_PURLI|nr:Tho complex subunit 7/Mft1p [Purpureocillium lilacinum]
MRQSMDGCRLHSVNYIRNLPAHSLSNLPALARSLPTTVESLHANPTSHKDDSHDALGRQVLGPTMASWELLDERSESELHKTRLLNVEEKPFKRITKRLGAISSAVSSAGEARNGAEPSALLTSDSLREDLTFDFAAFDSSIARFQFLHDANQRERERYEADKQQILAECQEVRGSNGQLREQLEAARATLAQRKKFDELAEKITSNRLLRPREDQRVNLAKLEDECRDLERESETYSATWRERRDQFNKIMEEGMMLRRQIRDEKEEVDRREGMNEGGEDDADADKEDKEGQTPKNAPSEHPTPRPDGDSQTKAGESEGETPRPVSSGALTPSAGTPRPEKPKTKSSLSRDARQRLEAQDAPTPSSQADDAPREDVEMEEREQLDKEDIEEGEELDEEGGEASGDKPASNADTMEVDD